MRQKLNLALLYFVLFSIVFTVLALAPDAISCTLEVIR